MRRKSDAVARGFFDIEASGAAAVEATLQLLLIREQLHDPNRNENQKQNEDACDPIDPRPVSFIRLIGQGRIRRALFL
jgi:hypothetical protein